MASNYHLGYKTNVVYLKFRGGGKKPPISNLFVCGTQT